MLARMLAKLHVQYSHMSVSKLVAMLKTVRDTKGMGVLDRVAENFVCHHCIKFAKSKPNPVVSAPRVPSFNHQVYIDVFWIKGIQVLHMVCAYSAYRQAAVLTEKTGQAVVFALLNFWFRYLGPMKSLRIDLGTEFDNQKVIELSGKYGFEVDPSPGGAHWVGGDY